MKHEWSLVKTPKFKRRLKTLIFFRPVLAAILLFEILLIRQRGIEDIFLPSLRVVFTIIGIQFAVSAVFYFIYRFSFRSRFDAPSLPFPSSGKGWDYFLVLFVLAQIAWDLLFTTSFVYITGGIESEFKFLYWITICMSAILLFRVGAFSAAAISGILYGILLNLELFNIFPTYFAVSGEASLWLEDRVIRSIFFQSIGFFTVALASSWISNWARQAEAMLVEKSADLEDLEDLMGRIVESLTSGLATLDAQGRINFWSRAAEEISTLRYEDVKNKLFTDVFPEAKVHIGSESDRSDQKPWRWEMLYQRPEGVDKTLGFSIAPLRHVEKGESQGTVVIFQDLTHYREMEDQVKRADRLAAVGELAARMAHEIRNPLTSMAGSIEVLQQRLSLEKSDHKLMDIVLRETDRLNQLLTDFLVYAKPQPPKFEHVSLDQLVKETAELFSKNSVTQGIEIVSEIEPEIFVYADPMQLSQLMWNLIKNASESMKQGGRIYVRVVKNSGRAAIEVRDEGEGIPIEIQREVFQPFYTTKTKGTGLGLATVKRIAEDHYGEISFTTGKEEGTTFRVEIPLEGVGHA